MGRRRGGGCLWGLTWLAHGELHRTPGVEQLLDQRLGQHGGREEDGPAALAVEGAHQAVGDQAEVLAQLALWVQLWEGAGKGWLWLGRGTRGPSWPHRVLKTIWGLGEDILKALHTAMHARGLGWPDPGAGPFWELGWQRWASRQMARPPDQEGQRWQEADSKPGTYSRCSALDGGPWTEAGLQRRPGPWEHQRQGHPGPRRRVGGLGPTSRVCPRGLCTERPLASFGINGRRCSDGNQ